MNRKSFYLALAVLMALAAGCGDETPQGRPPGIDLKASQTPAVTAPTLPKAAKAAKRGDVHRPGPSMTME
jgi:hypothetical protein